MMYFDASNPYHRYMLHYESDEQLSLPEIIARKSVDVYTAAILWFMIEKHASFIIAGPTDPTPGVGKTTTLNALLPFYPEMTNFIYTIGMYESFGFVDDVPAETTTVLANEISDHLRIYMWGHKARQLLDLTSKGYAIASTCHADTLSDVIAMLQYQLHIQPKEIQQLQFIVNIGLHGIRWPYKRRWLTTHLVLPQDSEMIADGYTEQGIPVMEISHWSPEKDTFSKPKESSLKQIASWSNVPFEEVVQSVSRRAKCLEELATISADTEATIEAILNLRIQEQELQQAKK
jgi:hypothetical protein